MFDDYAIEGEDLDWTKVTDPRERKRLQNIINGRKYRERRMAGEAAEAAARGQLPAHSGGPAGSGQGQGQGIGNANGQGNGNGTGQGGYGSGPGTPSGFFDLGDGYEWGVMMRGAGGSAG